MKKENPRLFDKVAISLQYQRSIRIDIDLGRSDGLNGFVCHDTAAKVIENMAIQTIETNQRAYTWTGPFGGGKSSLALAFASALSKDKDTREKSRNKLRASLLPIFDEAFPVKSNGWLIIPVVGKRTSFCKEIIKSFNKNVAISDQIDEHIDAEILIETLIGAANDSENDGVLLIIDEMGKFLESAVSEGYDIHFFQDLAEAAARSNGKLIIIGILHQSFRNYASKLDNLTRNDWSKIQGRFSDLPFIVSSHEIVDLISKAIKTDIVHRDSFIISTIIAESIRRRRPVTDNNLAIQLDACWPLHPAVCVLLGPISRKQFGQNERSTFTFLSSVEPNGFQDFLKTTKLKDGHWYRPENYWEYIRTNFESAIQSSMDGHRWSQAVEAVERTEARVKQVLDLRVSLVKTIAIINLFKNGTGLSAESEVLKSIYPEYIAQDIDNALMDLSLWRVAVYRKHLDAWVIFEGSDFDVDSAIRQAKVKFEHINLNELSSLAGLYPIVAKRHYHRTGALRWMDVSFLAQNELEQEITKFNKSISPRIFGKFILMFPNKGSDVNKMKEDLLSINIPKDFIVGIPSNFESILLLGEELLALNKVKDSYGGILEGDSVARREVLSRIDFIKLNIDEEIHVALSQSTWIFEGKEQRNLNMHVLSSELADKKFVYTPIMKTELLNRTKLSPNASKARKELMHKMVNNCDEEFFGLKGYPAERAIYDIILKATKLHNRSSEGKWEICSPLRGNPLFILWETTDNIFQKQDKLIHVSEIYDVWNKPPFGILDGIKPILFLAYFLSRQNILSVYKNKMFLPILDDVGVDEILQDGSSFSLRKVIINEEKLNLLQGITEILKELKYRGIDSKPLSAARGLVDIVFRLPLWTKRTRRLTSTSLKVRDLLLKASDPYKILFVDLMNELGCDNQPLEYLKKLKESLVELMNAYTNMMEKIRCMMMLELGDDASILEKRCDNIKGLSGDFRFDAFVNRLRDLGNLTHGFEGILSLAVNKPSREWSDSDLDTAELEIAKWVTKFRQYEAYASIKGRESNRDAYAIVAGNGSSLHCRIVEFDISEYELDLAKNAVYGLFETLVGKGNKPEALLAAFTEVGMNLVERKK